MKRDRKRPHRPRGKREAPIEANPGANTTVDTLDLRPQHEALVRGSAITPDVARARGYRSVTTKSKLIEIGFGKAQALVPALVIPVWNVHGEIGLYQARPDTPRIKDGKAIKYETPRGSRMVIDVPPVVRQWLADPSRPLFVTEGIRKADAAASVGLACIALLGVWNWRGTNEWGGRTALPDWESIALNGRIVYITFDSDIMTKPSVHASLTRLKPFLESRKADVWIIYLPPGPNGEKVGLDDYLAAGHTKEDLLALATSSLRSAEGTPSEVRVGIGPYLIDAGRLCVQRRSRDGDVTVALCNFIAGVTEEVILDDGVETSRAFVIDGSLDTGEHLPRIRVPSQRFGAMSWVPEHWGLRAVVRAGLSTRDQLREAIQVFSREAGRRHVFTHTGWRLIENRWVYLHAGGGLGNASIDVDLGTDLSRYRIPDPTIDPVTAMRVSLSLLKLGPLTVTTPPFAGVYRAPLASAFPLDLSIWFEGQTGSLKSTLAALSLSHFGTFDRTSLPGAWSSTANQLERRAFILKDTIFVVDDYAPSALDRNELQTKAARLLRAQGNLAGRGRLNADLTERPAYPPRGLILATGEQHPVGHSILARTFLVEVTRSDIDLGLLSQAQERSASLVHAMGGYLSWLAPQMSSMPSILREAFRTARAKAHRDGSHLRSPEALAHLWLGIDCGFCYAEEIGAVQRAEAEELRHACWEALVEGSRAQSLMIEDEKPTRFFVQVLSTLVLQGRGLLLPSEHPDKHVGPEVPLFGWQDGDHLYLLPEAVFQAVSRFARDSSEPFPVSQSRLRKDLVIEGLSLPDSGRTTASVWVGGRSRRVLRLKKSAVAALLGEEPAETSPNLTALTGFQE